MTALICNSSKALRYYDAVSGLLLDRTEVVRLNDWAKRVRAADLNAHVLNGVPPFPRPDRYRSVVGLFPVPPLTRWSVTDGRFFFHSAIEPDYPSSLSLPSLDDVDHVARDYLGRLGGKKIAIELSGGLDTGIVIDVVRAAGGRPLLVGFVSDRYEFRTERFVQELYQQDNEVIAIPQDEVRPFARLEETPLHALPAAPALFHRLHSVIAEAAAAGGASCVLNGVGGDALLCDDFSSASTMPDEYRAWGLYDPWPNDNVYAPRGMSYVPAFALWPFPQMFWTMRKGQKEDTRKNWARRLFTGRLPAQLTQWTYKGDHVGHFISGMKAARGCVCAVAKTAYEVTGDDTVAPRRLSMMIDRSAELDDKQERYLLSLISFSTWIHGLVRDGIV